MSDRYRLQDIKKKIITKNMYVIKRDKTEELFQIEKIENAIKRAFDSCGKEIDYDVVDCV